MGEKRANQPAGQSLHRNPEGLYDPESLAVLEHGARDSERLATFRAAKWILANMAAMTVPNANTIRASKGMVDCAATVRRYGAALSNRIDAVSL